MRINFAQVAQRSAPIRLGCFVLTLLLIWLPLALPIYLFIKDANLVTILTMVLLYVEFIILLQLWGKQVYKQPQILKEYGLEISRKNGVELLRGLAMGILGLIGLYVLQGVIGWLVWQKPAMLLSRLILEGLIVSLFYGFAEELLFRGWLLVELQRDYHRRTAMWIDALLFATLHFRLIQFPALLVLGLLQVWGKQWCRERLGLPIGYHAGIIWGFYIINVGNMVKYTNKVPQWITGVDNNPLQGLLSLIFLGGTALWIRKQAQKIDLSV
jgi:hypothetical protein